MSQPRVWCISLLGQNQNLQDLRETKKSREGISVPPLLSEKEKGVLAGCKCAGDGVGVFPEGDWTENSRATDFLTSGSGISR